MNKYLAILFMGFKKTLTSIVLSGALAFWGSSAKAWPIFYDDFESGTDYKWYNKSGDWKVIEEDGNHVYRQDMFVGGGRNWLSSTANCGQDYFKVEADLKFLERRPGDAGASIQIYRPVAEPFNNSDENLISLAIFPRSQYVSLYIVDPVYGFNEFMYPTSLESGKWYKLGIEVNNGNVNAYLNDGLIIKNKPTTLSRGYFSLVTDDLRTDFDNVKVYGVPEPLVFGLLSLGSLALLKRRRVIKEFV